MNCFRRMTVTSLLASCVALAFGASSAYAQKSPARPVRLVIPLTAGGGADTTARILAQKLSENTGQPLSRIEVDTERDYYLTADEAKAYGLVDDVIAKRP